MRIRAIWLTLLSASLQNIYLGVMSGLTPDNMEVVVREPKTEREVTLRLGKSGIYREPWSMDELSVEGALSVEARGSKGQIAVLVETQKTS